MKAETLLVILQKIIYGFFGLRKMIREDRKRDKDQGL